MEVTQPARRGCLRHIIDRVNIAGVGYDVDNVAASVIIIGSRSAHPPRRPSSGVSWPMSDKRYTELFYSIEDSSNRSLWYQHAIVML